MCECEFECDCWCECEREFEFECECEFKCQLECLTWLGRTGPRGLDRGIENQTDLNSPVCLQKVIASVKECLNSGYTKLLVLKTYINTKERCDNYPLNQQPCTCDGSGLKLPCLKAK